MSDTPTTAAPWSRFTLQQVVSNLREYQAQYTLTKRQAFVGICEGHELTATEENELAAAIFAPDAWRGTSDPVQS